MKRFNLYVAAISLLIDATAIFVGLVLAYVIRSGGSDIYAWPFHTYLKLIAAILPVWVILLASQRVYGVRTIVRGWNLVPRLLVGLMAGWAVMIISFYFWRNPAAESFPRLIIIYGVILTSGLMLIGRFLVGLFISLAYRQGLGVVRTVIISTTNSGFCSTLSADRRSGRRILAILKSPDMAMLEQQAKLGLDELIVISKLPEETMLNLLNWAELKGISFVTVPSLISVRSSNVEISTLAGTPVMYWQRSPLEGWGRIFKRLLDLILVIPALLVLSPIYLILAVLVRLTSPGPIIFRHQRVGQDGASIIIYKFRSMVNDPDRKYPEFGGWSSDEAADPRITPLGRFMRQTNLDELPQLWDVFIGKMSLVGPRPEQPQYVAKFASEIPDYLRRHYVKSGLTGWAQINGARGNTSIEERVKYDLYYIEHWSIWFDIRIILATFVFLFRQVVKKG